MSNQLPNKMLDRSKFKRNLRIIVSILILLFTITQIFVDIKIARIQAVAKKVEAWEQSLDEYDYNDDWENELYVQNCENAMYEIYVSPKTKTLSEEIQLVDQKSRKGLTGKIPSVKILTQWLDTKSESMKYAIETAHKFGAEYIVYAKMAYVEKNYDFSPTIPEHRVLTWLHYLSIMVFILLVYRMILSNSVLKGVKIAYIIFNLLEIIIANPGWYHAYASCLQINFFVVSVVAFILGIIILVNYGSRILLTRYIYTGLISPIGIVILNIMANGHIALPESMLYGVYQPQGMYVLSVIIVKNLIVFRGVSEKRTQTS